MKRVIERRSFGVVVGAGVLAIACLGPAGCSEPAQSVVSQQMITTFPNAPSTDPGTDGPGTFEPVGELPPDKSLAELFAEKNCSTTEACTTCQRDSDCGSAIGRLEGCARAACIHGICAVTAERGCLPRPLGHEVICGVGGPAGATVACDVKVYRDQDAQVTPAELSFELSFPSTVVKFKGFMSPWDSAFAPPALVGGGEHSVMLRPEAIADWQRDGKGRALVTPPQSGNKNLVTAQKTDTGISGNAVVLRAVFELSHPVLTSMNIRVREPGAKGPFGQVLPSMMRRGQVVVVADPNALCPGGDCSGSPASVLENTGICELTGNAGDTRDCLFQVITGTPLFSHATELEATVVYDATVLTAENLYTSRCFDGAGCFDLPLAGPDATATASGHNFAVVPTDVSDWQGVFAFRAMNTTEPTRALSAAAMDEHGEFTADPVVAWVRFQLTKDVPADQPALVKLATEGTDAPIAFDAQGRQLPIKLQHGLITTGEAIP